MNFPCGHPRTALTTYTYRGRETCRVCKLERNKSYYRDHPERHWVPRLLKPRTPAT